MPSRVRPASVRCSPVAARVARIFRNARQPRRHHCFARAAAHPARRASAAAATTTTNGTNST
eukprot:1393505-Pyramimonas_sp.AAC.1